ncbi:hypothetical protein CFN78_06910 [Amycolatopsis antarctica]|uniref:Uncharacterized protein n=1 Tax=Amycolatopsis antarctica TaxID=1854586 RepID=A0A263D6L9_9PSEU|nr:hypothetical protein [Amycolatopsis antarctica]OZM74011.1 hypothetical protein CFN78_06910 [Amycolatopsis antarctica]
MIDNTAPDQRTEDDDAVRFNTAAWHTEMDATKPMPSLYAFVYLHETVSLFLRGVATRSSLLDALVKTDVGTADAKAGA